MSFMPHRHCYINEQWLVHTQAGIEILIACVYLAIPALIVYHIIKAHSGSYEVLSAGVFYSCFIGLCGITHVIAAVNLYTPHYYEKAIIGAITAFVSVLALYKTPAMLRGISKLVETVERYKDQLETFLQQKAFIENLEHSLLALLHSAPLPTAKVGLNGQFLEVNRLFAEMVGLTPKQLAAKTFQDITTPETLKKDLRLLKECLSGKREHYTVHKSYIHQKTKREIEVVLQVLTVRNADGSVAYFIAQILSQGGGDG